MKRSSSKETSTNFKPGYSVKGSGIPHTSSTTRMLQTEVYTSQHDLPSDDQFQVVSRFSPTSPTVPAAVNTPPTTNTLEGDIIKPTPMKIVPQRPPARKPPPVPKPFPSSHGVLNESSSSHHDHASSAPSFPPTKPTGVQKPPPLVPPSVNKSTSATPTTQLRPTPISLPEEDKQSETVGAQRSPPLVVLDTDKPIQRADAPNPRLRPAPMTPPKIEKPSTPPERNIPVKPILASKPAPAPKSISLSALTNEEANVAAPKPKPKPKPRVPAEKPAVKPEKPAIKPEKPAVKPEGVVPPKPVTKQAGLDSGLNKPHPGNSLLQ